MEVKPLQIETAEKWEAAGLKTLASYQEFRSEVKVINQITDIFADPRVKIKQDQNKYIFNINGVNKFMVDTPKLEERLNIFYDEKKQNEQRKAEEEVHVRIEWLEITYMKSRTQEELNDLQYEINRTNNRIEHATDIESIKYKVGRLIAFFEQEKDLTNESIGRFGWTKYDRKDKGLLKINKTEIKRRLKQLNKIKKQIERLENNKGKKYTIDRKNEEGDVEVKMDDINGFDEKTTLLQLNQRIEELGKEAPEFIKTRNEIILENADTTPYYELILNNVKDAAKLKMAIQKVNDDYILLNKMNLSVDKRQALQQDLKRLQEYLEKYANNPNKPLEPFVPQSWDAFEKLCEIDPDLKQYTKLNKTAGRPSDGEESYDWSVNPEYYTLNEGEGNTTNNNNQWAEYTPSPYGSWKEAFEKGGVGGIMNYWIDKTNMKPEQKQFRWGVGNLAITGWMIFVGWKMLSSAFKLLTKKGRNEENLGKNLGRLLGPAALIFGAQARSGEWPMSLFTWGVLTEKLANIFGGKKNNENLTQQEQETQITYAEGFPWASALFNGLTYGEMSQFLIEDGDQIKIDPNKYDTLIDMFKTGPKKNDTAVAFLESLGKDDERRVIDLALTGMGITADDLKKNPNKEFNVAASNAIVSLQMVELFLDTKWYNKVNPETQYLLDDYISGKADYDLDYLERRGDVFYKSAEIVDKTGLQTKITELGEGNKQREEDLLLAINTFYDYMPNAEKKIDIQWKRPTITFGTYNQTTTINLANKELIGFTPSRFSSYAEVFKAANLSNYIKDICKDKETNTPTPFHISNTGNIEFSEPSLWTLDTKILTAGRGGALKNISQTLEDNKQAYCDYLNNLKFRKQ